MKHSLTLLIIALLAAALPAAAQKKKVTDEERQQAIMRVYDLLESGKWVMVIDNITTTKVSYSQLLAESNYILVADSLMTIQVDVAGANVQTNLNPLERTAAEGYANRHPDRIEAARVTQRDYYHVVRTATETNRRGTQIVHKLYLSTPDNPNHSTFSRLMIDPITLEANFGVYSGHFMAADEAVLVNTQPRYTDAQQRTIDSRAGIDVKAHETVRFKLIAGYDYNYNVISTRIPETIDDVLDPCASTFQIGVGIDCHAAKWAQGLSLQGALTYSPLRISSAEPVKVLARNPDTKGYKYQTKPWQCRGDMLNISLGAQYSFGQGRVRPLIRGGVTVRYFINNVFKDNVDSNGMYRVTHEKFYYNFNNGLQASAYVGTGCTVDFGRHTLGLHLDAALDRAGLSAEFVF